MWMGYGGAWPDDAPVEVVVGPVPLERVARPAERQQVPLVTRPAPRPRRHVVHLKVPDIEVTPAPVAPPLLPPEQYICALPVGDESRGNAPTVRGQSAYWVQYNSGKKSLAINQ